MERRRSRASRPGLWTLLLSALLAPSAEGAEEVPRPSLVEEIEVKGRRPPRTDTLEVREVRETPARDLGEALAAQANAAKVRKGGIASDVVLRGMKKDDVAVLIDGQQLHGACPSRMDPPSFHLDYAEVDRVEVRRGPFDVTHPGGLGGRVEVRTRGARPGPRAEANLGAGSFGALESSAVLSYGSSRGDALAGGSWKTGQPFRSGDGRNFTLAVPTTLGGQPNGGRYRDTSSGQTAYDVASGWVKIGMAPAEGQRLEASYTRQSATSVLYPYLLMDGLRDDTDRVNVQYALGELGPLSSGLAQLYWNQVEHDMADEARCSSAADLAACAGALPREYGMRTLARSSVLGGKVEAGFEGPGEGLRWLVGADFSVRNWDNVTTRVMRAMPGQPYADEASIPDVTIGDVGLFGQARHALGPDLWLTAGARLDVAQAHAAIDRTALYAQFHPGVSPSRQRTDLLPGATLQVDWAVAPGVSLFAGYGHATRAPDQQERFFALTGMGGRPAWVGNPDLRPSRNDEVDVGARYSEAGVLLEATAYHSWVGDYVALVPAVAGTATAKTYDNVDARLYGGEASAQVRLPLHLFAGARLAYTRGLTRSGSLAEIPPLQTAVSLRFDAGWIFAEVEEAMAARQARVDATLQEQPTGAWAITNLKLGLDGWGLRLFCGVRNLLDKQYTEHLSYQRDPFASGVVVPEPGRTFHASAQARF